MKQRSPRSIWPITAAVLIGACASISTDAQEDPYVSEQRAAAEARSKDSAWKPKTKEIALIQIGDKDSPGKLKNYCLNQEGNILACFEDQIRVYSAAGKLLRSMPTPIRAGAISVGENGSIFIGGEGKLIKLSPEGKVIATAESPVASAPVKINKETEEMVREMAKETRRPFEEEMKKMQASLENRRADVTGIAVTEQDVFLAVPSPTDFSYRVYRLTHALEEPKLVVEKLRGCCGTMDVQAHEGKMWIPHNARHAVENYDRDGKQLAKFGKSGKLKPADFGGCCEPKCMRVLPDGDILVAESGPPTAIKRFSSTGKFKEVVALV
ncbi:MAG: hypothetical protein ACXW3L_09460, partial [Limisphaerales bacterium]